MLKRAFLNVYPIFSSIGKQAMRSEYSKVVLRD